MNSFQEIDYDQKIKEFIGRWEEDNRQDSKAFKSALTGILVPYIYKVIREEKLSEKKIKRRKYYFSRLKNVKEVIVHAAWYVLWTLKWLVFITFKNKNKRIILGSFFPKNKTSFEYIRFFLKRNTADKSYLINFSVIYNLESLLNPGLFCYPHFFSRNKSIITRDYSSLNNEFKQLFKDFFGIDFRYSIKEYIKSFIGVYNSFSYLIEWIQMRNKILYFVQDCDYLNDRVLFSYICKIKDILSISFDHSIQIYDHLFFNNYSDYRITWGEYHVDRIKKLSNNYPQMLISIGRPGCTFSSKSNNKKKNDVWIYFLPAFQEANMQSIHRSLQQTEENIAKIKNIITDKYSDVHLLIKPHPSDEKEIFLSKSKLFSKPNSNLNCNYQLAFIEDSTVSIELLQCNAPVIYFADSQESDRISIKKFGVDFNFVTLKDNLEHKISEALKKQIDPEKRELMFTYYFGDGKYFETNLDKILYEIGFR